MLKARTPQAEAGQAPTQTESSGKSEVGALLDAFGKSAARAIGSQVGREIMRGVLGSIFGSTTTRRRR
jgi:hypothetical protein